jgi:hypothetical protein
MDQAARHQHGGKRENQRIEFHGQWMPARPPAVKHGSRQPAAKTLR